MRSAGEEEAPGADDSESDGSGAGGFGPGGFGFGSPVFQAPASAVEAIGALRGLAAEDVRAMDDETCLGLFDALETIDRLFHSARFGVLSELDARSVTDRRFGHTVANEAGWRHGSDPRRVKRDLRTANTIRRTLPKVASALAAGTLPVDRVRVLASGVNERNRDAVTATQAELLDIAAQQCTFTGFCRDVEQVTRLADLDGPEPPQPPNHGTIARDGDHVTASFDLHGPGSVGFTDRVNAETDRLYRQWTVDHEHCSDIDVPPRSELVAQAIMNLVKAGTAHRHTGRIDPTADISIVIDVDETTVSDLFTGGILLPGPDRGHGHGHGAGPVDWSKKATDLTGARLRHSNREWEMLTCDPTYTWILTAADGQPVACRTGERHASRQQRRALNIRDRGCVFPGCDAPVDWCDAHHIQPHANSGPTEIRNLVLLCRRHHGVIHRTGWTITTNPNAAGDGFYLITSPTGTVLTTRHTRQHRQPDPA